MCVCTDNMALVACGQGQRWQWVGQWSPDGLRVASGLHGVSLLSKQQALNQRNSHSGNWVPAVICSDQACFRAPTQPTQSPSSGLLRGTWFPVAGQEDHQWQSVRPRHSTGKRTRPRSYVMKDRKNLGEVSGVVQDASTNLPLHSLAAQQVTYLPLCRYRTYFPAFGVFSSTFCLK